MPKRNAQPFLRTSLGTPVTTTPYIIRSAIRTPTNTITPNQHRPTLYNKECHSHPSTTPSPFKIFRTPNKKCGIGGSHPHDFVYFCST